MTIRFILFFICFQVYFGLYSEAFAHCWFGHTLWEEHIVKPIQKDFDHAITKHVLHPLKHEEDNIKHKIAPKIKELKQAIKLLRKAAPVMKTLSKEYSSCLHKVTNALTWYNTVKKEGKFTKIPERIQNDINNLKHDKNEAASNPFAMGPMIAKSCEDVKKFHSDLKEGQTLIKNANDNITSAYNKCCKEFSKDLIDKIQGVVNVLKRKNVGLSAKVKSAKNKLAKMIDDKCIIIKEDLVKIATLKEKVDKGEAFSKEGVDLCQ